MSKECGGKSFFRDILPEISRICALSLEAGREKMTSTGNLKSFQLFGFDLMIDENFKVRKYPRIGGDYCEMPNH